MRTLVLGGTAFLGRAVAAEAVARGHEVVCAARGRSGAVPAGAKLVEVDRDRSDGLAELAGERFDAVVDVATISHRWVADALRVLGPTAGHWSFVSTVNVYADVDTRGQGPDAPLLEPIAEHGSADSPEFGPEFYGGIKVASENAVRGATDGAAFVVRPGLITGPDDRSDRFGYWPARFLRGGRVLVPDVPGQPAQHLDVRDLAGWIVTAGEQRIAGCHDGVGPAEPLLELLGEIAAVVEPSAEVEFVPVAPDALAAAGVNAWGGPRSLPLMAPEDHWGFLDHDAAPSLAAGLRIRPLAETVAGALATERALGSDRARKAGMSAAEEAEVLASLA
ncbi:MAG TPA: NAD-dependent epimerase/dehydratase family protein [Pseudonocardiaceae bacterium]|jgi:nucleoside-diphosphate-sugar epimerase|nr:NAD-dependent epimerase/dehydratase family protein [Pseudonocardiaceae bacterium]